MSVLGEMQRLFGRGYVFVVALMVGSLVGVTGCAGPDHQALCEASEQCYAGNDKDVEACVVAREYEEFTDCFIEEATCREEQQGNTCTTNEECMNSGFDRCSNGFCASTTFGLPSGTACERESNTYNSCN